MYTEQEQEEAKARLREILKPGDCVHTILRHVSRSGMMRIIDPYIIRENEPCWIGFLVASALDWPYSHRKNGVKVGGCGMDMGFHLVYELGAVLWPTGTPEPHGTRNGEPDREGGYALKGEWL